MVDTYNIRDDYYVERYFEDKDLSDETEKTYVKHLKKFSDAVGKKLTEIIDDCKAQQEIKTEEIISSSNDDGTQIIQKRVIEFDADGPNSLVMQYFKKFEKDCKSRGNKNTTINSGLDTIKAVLSHFKVKLPNFPNLEDDADNWELLSKEDFKFILADSSLMHKSLILFMLSSGIRIYDCLNFTIGDYMDATSEYHDFVEVEDFIDNAPDYMMGYWEFEPHKTEKKHTLCKTFNSPESNKFILQNVRRVKNEYMPKKSTKSKKLKLTKSDALFGSKRGFYKKAPEVFSISTMFGRKNKKLYEWHINRINQDIKNGKISAEDYDKQVELIPKFHPHACRKYFCTMIERHTSNERRYRLMEGHAPKNKLDKSYINISKKEIAEVYDDAVGDLSVYYNDNEDINKLREDFDKQLEDIEDKHQKEIAHIKLEHEKELLSVKNDIEQLDKKIEQSRTSIPAHRVRDVIISYLMSIGELDNDRCSLLNLMVWNYAQNNPDDFEDTPEYLFELVQKLDLQIELSNKDIRQQSFELSESITPEIDNLTVIIINDLLNIIQSNETVMKRVGHIDTIKFDYIAEEYLVSSNWDLENLSDDDRNEMAGEVLMKYLNYKD